MATITPVPEGVKVVVPAGWDRSMRVAMASRRARVPKMTARSAAIFRELGTDPRERTFLPEGWPKDGLSVAVLAELRRIDANWTWDKARKLVWLDGSELMVSEVADRLGVVVGKAPAKDKAPKVEPVAEVVPVRVAEVAVSVDELDSLPATYSDLPPVPVVPTCSRCSRPSELEVCQTCADSLADDQARKPVSLGGDGGPLAEYLGRLLHEPKRVFALELVAHLRDGAPAPTSEAEWAPKVAAKVRRYLKAAA